MNNKTDLEILVQLKDEASAEFKKAADSMSSDSFRLRSNFQGLSTDVSGLSKMLLGGAVAIGGLAVAFGVSAVKAFSEAQVAMGRVDSTLKSMTETTMQVSTGMTRAVTTFKVTGIEAEEMNLKIKKLQEEMVKNPKTYEENSLAIRKLKAALAETDTKYEEMTRSVRFSKEEIAKAREEILRASEAAVQLGFDDEAVAESITKLYQRTGDLTQAQKLNNLAMDLARAKQLDLNQAANLVNMVLSGQGKILAQYGITLKDTASPMEALLQLQKLVAGQASTFSQTFQGQMQVLSVEFGNIKESIGQVLVEALLPFIQQFSGWLRDPETKKNFQYWTAEFKSWAEVIIPVIIDTFKMWFDWATKLFNVLQSIGNTIVSIVNSMNALGKNGTGGLDGLINAWKNAGSNIMWAAQGAVPGRASGGPVSGGSMYMVGEEGPELFVPGMSGAIIPNPALAGMGGAQISINIGTLYGTDDDAAERFANLISKRLNQQLKLKMA